MALLASGLPGVTSAIFFAIRNLFPSHITTGIAGLSEVVMMRHS